MHSMRIAGAVFVAGIVAGCTDRPGSTIVAPVDPQSSRQGQTGLGFGANPLRQAIEGHATLVPISGLEQKYEVEAMGILGQAARGQFEYKGTRNGPFRVHGSVYCFMVQGSLARVAARVEQSSNASFPIGSYLIWSFEDRDTEPNSHPDLSTEPQPADQALASFHCAVGISTGLFYPVQGNLEVHPELDEH